MQMEAEWSPQAQALALPQIGMGWWRMESGERRAASGERRVESGGLRVESAESAESVAFESIFAWATLLARAEG